MRLLVTRPEPDNQRIAEALAAQGHQTLLEPLLKIEGLDSPIEIKGAQAVIATSRNALRALQTRQEINSLRTLPLFAVGPASAELADELGFAKVHTGEGDASQLVPLIRSQFASGATLLHLVGEDRAFDLKSALAAHGFDVRQTILYRSIASERLGDAAQAALRDGKLDGVILMSPRTAETFAALIKAHGLEDAAARLRCYCLSRAVGDALAGLRVREIKTPMRPRQDELLAMIGGLTAH